jgi:aspartate 1-decarboxylase
MNKKLNHILINFAKKLKGETLMFRTLMNGKIHRATVTEANLNYVGSITIDEDILDAVDMVANEKVQIVNNNNGERFETYIIKGERGSGVVCLNGAAARRVHVGDIVIIVSYAILQNEEIHHHHPKVALMDENNRIKEMLTHEPEATVMF